MPDSHYTYDPAKVKEPGKDKMRFELGDVMVQGGPETTALTDQEIEAALELYPRKWKRAKLFLLGSLYHRFGYEVDTKTGPLSLELQERAKFWRQEYEDLKKELETESVAVPDSMQKGGKRPPYFYAGMQENHRAYQPGGGHRW